MATNAQWAIDSLNDIITDTAPVNGRHVESGQLVVSDARAFTGGPGMATDVICSALGTQENEDVYLEGVISILLSVCIVYCIKNHSISLYTGFITPLISTPAGNTVNESGSIRLVCINPNIPGLSTLEWRDPQDNPLGSIVLITLSSINRTDAGMYECRLTNRVDNSTRSTFQNIIVQCELMVALVCETCCSYITHTKPHAHTHTHTHTQPHTHTTTHTHTHTHTTTQPTHTHTHRYSRNTI